jgi:hypothetical protein
MSDADAVEQTVVVDIDDRAKLLQLASAHGVEVTPVGRRSIDPITMVALTLTGTALAVGMVMHLIDREKGGQVIDLRPGATKMIYRTHELVYGLILIISHDGAVSVEVKEPKGMLGAVLETLRGILSDVAAKTIDAAASSIHAAVGDRAEVRRLDSVDVPSALAAPTGRE